MTNNTNNSVTGPFDLSQQPIHLDAGAEGKTDAVALEGFNFDGPSFGTYIDKHCQPGAPGRLVMIESTPTSWATWERHTEGAEVVHVLEGSGEFIQQIDGEEVRIDVVAGTTLINPVNVWHTADVVEPIKAIYITPCPGTENKPR